MNKAIQKITVVAAALSFGVLASAQVGINETGAAPDASAMVDVSSTTKGVLAPRMSEAQRLAIPAPANGLLIYQTNGKIGYWYYDASIPGWTSVFVGSEPWTLKGNTGTNPATQFLGTTNAQPLVFGTNGAEAARIQNNGRMGMGVAAPVEVLDMDGAIKITNTAAANTQGAVQWNAVDGYHEGNTDGTATGWYPLENVFVEEDPWQWAEVVSSCSTPPGGYVQIGAGTGTTSGTIETPYGTLWEDNKVQFLWLQSTLQAANMCPNEDITALAFNAVVTGTAYAQDNANLGMLQTTAADLSAGFESGTLNLWSANGHQPVNGWNQYIFASPFQWNGSANLVVEYSFDNCDWAGNEHIRTDATPHTALYGMYCDACGGTGYNTCIGACLCPGVPCGCGAIGGNGFDNNTSTVTCDGCGSWVGGRGPANKRAQIRFYTLTGGSVVNYYNDRMIYYNGGLMIGDAAWATSGGPIPAPFSFKGPGTIVGENGVWGGGTLLSDYVFDIYFDGKARPEDAERTQDYDLMPIEEMANYVELERHLPTIQGREAWEAQGEFSLDQLSTELWVTVEQQALYIKELNERMKTLREHLVEKNLKPGE